MSKDNYERVKQDLELATCEGTKSCYSLADSRWPGESFPKLNKALAVEWSLKNKGYWQNLLRQWIASQDKNRRIELHATKILQPQLNRRERLPFGSTTSNFPETNAHSVMNWPLIYFAARLMCTI